MPSLTDVAKRAGVSLSTASSVLNPGAKLKFVSETISTRVRDAARELGYVTNYHARSMKLRKAQMIAVVLDMPPTHATPRTELGSSYFGTLFGSAAVAARHAGYATTIIGADANTRATARGIHAVQQRQIDGLILLAMLEESQTDSLYLDPPELPMVAIEPSLKTPLPSVHWDMSDAVHRVVEHLAGLGHQQIIWLGPEPHDGAEPAAARELAFVQRMWELGLKGRSCRYRREEPKGSQSVGETYIDPAVDAMRAILQASATPDFTAVVCYNDTTALGALAALRERGVRVPEEVSVAGFDDTEAVFATPKLTTVRQPLEQMSETAFQLLRQMLDDPRQISAMRGQREVIKGELVVRGSTGIAR